MDRASSTDGRDGFLAAFDRQGQFLCLYSPSDFAEGDWPIAHALRLAISAISLAQRALH